MEAAKDHAPTIAKLALSVEKTYLALSELGPLADGQGNTHTCMAAILGLIDAGTALKNMRDGLDQEPGTEHEAALHTARLLGMGLEVQE